MYNKHKLYVEYNKQTVYTVQQRRRMYCATRTNCM